MTHIKVCGVTRVEDAQRALDLGVDALGLNLWSGSARRCDRATALEIASLCEGRARIVVVTVDATPEDLSWIRASLPSAWHQLHGDEPDETLRACLPRAYRAARDEHRALTAPGIEVLLDASVPGMKGGTGERADWPAAARIAKQRPLWLAGGLRADNVAEAIAHVRPMGVDVASGVESAPGIKDPHLLESFVRAARGSGVTL